MKEEWTDRLRDRLSGYEESVPEGLWEDIESALSSRMTAGTPQRKSRAAAVLRRTVAAVMAAAAAVVTGYMLITGGSMSGVKKAETDVVTGRNSPGGGSGNGAKGTAVAHEAGLLAAVADENTHAASTKEPETWTPENATTDAAGTITGQHTDTQEPTEHRGSNNKSGSSTIGKGKDNRQTATYGTMPEHAGNGGGRISLSLYAQNSTVSTQRTAAQGTPLLFSSPTSSAPGGNAEGIQQDMLSILYTKQYTDIQSTKHHFPIRAGVSIRYDTGSRTGIESGLTYTLLRSEIISGNGKTLRKTRRRLHYIGIPLNISYTAWRGRHLEAYVSAGGEIQKCVSGKDDTETVTNGMVTSAESTATKENRLQLSAGAAAGIQYNLSPSISIYAEPGINWYPDNGSSMETIYKDKPLNFSVKAGVRVRITN